MTARVPDDTLIALANEHLGGLPGVSVEPFISKRKARNARAAHALHLPADEPILALYDDTQLGGGDDGFIATPAQICWRSFLEHPRRVLWEELEPTSIRAIGERLEIAGGQVPAPPSPGGAARARDFLLSCARRVRAGPAPYRDPARLAAEITPADALLRPLRRALGELGFVHYRPSIPSKMLDAARAVHREHLPAGEEILALYDDTILGSGTDGLLFTERRLCWRTFMGAPDAITWDDLDVERVTSDGPMLLLPDRRPIDLQKHGGMAALVAFALRKLPAARRFDRAAAPPSSLSLVPGR